MSQHNHNNTGMLVTATAAVTAATVSCAFFLKNNSSSSRSKPSQSCAEKVQKEEDVFLNYEIDYSMHKEHREKLRNRLMGKLSSSSSSAVVLLQGGSEVPKYDTDTNYAYRQESFFQYLFGVMEADFQGGLLVDSNQSFLVVHRSSPDEELWNGKTKSTDFFKHKYQVDFVLYQDELVQFLQQHEAHDLYLLKGKNTDSQMETTTTFDYSALEFSDEFKAKLTVDLDLLHPHLVECRVTKSEKELDILRYMNKVSSKAHIEVMRKIKPGMMEYQAESLFLHYCYFFGGARLHAYTCICGSGDNASVLHYGHAGAPNDKKLEKGDFFLNDMGGEFHCYASDITCTFPVGGVFSNDQKMIYEGVLKAHDAVIAALKPGVAYTEMHLLSHRALTEHFLSTGFFKNGTVDELMAAELSAYFYPHGLGHFMGLDVHDVGGYPKGTERSDRKILRYLRCGRTMEANMVITVEPGCYFIEAQLNDLCSNKKLASYVNMEMLARFRGMGGVRIESDVIVTKNGCENMTKVPRTVAEVELAMKQ